MKGGEFRISIKSEWNSFREPAGGGYERTYPGIGDSSSLDQDDPLHELDSGYSDACEGVLSVHHFQYPAFRAAQDVPLLPVISIRTSVDGKWGRKGKNGGNGISITKLRTEAGARLCANERNTSQ